MFDWLNRNAAAVQALASVFSVFATVVLLIITRRYVGLTQEMARAAREQVRIQQRTVATEAAQLTTLVDVFLGTLRKLPVEQTDADALRTVSVWKHLDVTTFGSLAAAVLGSRSEVQRAIQRLNWVHATLDRVQQTPQEDQSQWDQFPWEEWKRQIAEARSALQIVRGDAQTSEAITQDSPGT